MGITEQPNDRYADPSDVGPFSLSVAFAASAAIWAGLTALVLLTGIV